MPLTVALMLVAANDGNAANANASVIISLFMVNSSKNVHKIDAALGTVVDSELHEVPVVNQAQHGRHFRFV
jgi:hypothetical protein